MLTSPEDFRWVISGALTIGLMLLTFAYRELSAKIKEHQEENRRALGHLDRNLSQRIESVHKELQKSLDNMDNDKRGEHADMRAATTFVQNALSLHQVTSEQRYAKVEDLKEIREETRQLATAINNKFDRLFETLNNIREQGLRLENRNKQVDQR